MLKVGNAAGGGRLAHVAVRMCCAGLRSRSGIQHVTGNFRAQLGVSGQKKTTSFISLHVCMYHTSYFAWVGGLWMRLGI